MTGAAEHIKEACMKKRGKWGRRKSDYVIRYLLITLLAALIGAAAFIVTAYSRGDMGSGAALDPSSGTMDSGGIWIGGGAEPHINIKLSKGMSYDADTKTLS
jgi:hypothetical protein